MSEGYLASFGQGCAASVEAMGQQAYEKRKGK